MKKWWLWAGMSGKKKSFCQLYCQQIDRKSKKSQPLNYYELFGHDRCSKVRVKLPPSRA